MDLYIATTPYNIFNCIRVKEMIHKDIPADLIITDIAKENYKCFLEIKKKNLFCNVYFIEQKKWDYVSVPKNRFKRLLFIIERALKAQFWCDRIFKEECSCISLKKAYDRIFYDIFGFTQKYILFHMIKCNSKVKFFGIDCGVESYYDRSYIKIKFSKLRNSTRKLMKHCGGYYLNLEKVTTVDRPIIKIPILDKKNYQLVKILNKIFTYEKNIDFENEEIIFFDQIFETDIWNAFQRNVIDNIQNKIGEIAIKKHPRRKDIELYSKCKIYDMKNAYEMILLNCTEESTCKLLITHSSTAVFLPKLLFNEEPTVILLFDIFPQDDNSLCGIKIFVQQLQDSYEDKSKIIVPKSINGLLMEIEAKFKKN